MTDAILAARALSLLDLTDLSETCTPEAITALCGRAVSPFGKVAAVCIYPPFVAQAKGLLQGSGVKVATVINFPKGGEDLVAVLHEAENTLRDKVDEIDLVMPYQAFLRGNTALTREMIAAVRDLMPKTKVLKVILETGALQQPEVITSASEIALDAGADFIKTSTGKIAVSATPEAARLMLSAIKRSGKKAGFKAAGGIKTLADAKLYLDIADEIMGKGWATPATFRFGASGILDVLIGALKGEATIAKAGY